LILEHVVIAHGKLCSGCASIQRHRGVPGLNCASG
jgi:hypothetical protein